MVWSTTAGERPSPQTMLLVLPPLPVPLIAEQWDEQLPAAQAVPRIEDVEEDEVEDKAVKEEAEQDKAEETDKNDADARQRSSSPPQSGAKRKREDSVAAEGSERPRRTRTEHTPAPLNLAPSRHPKPVQPSDDAHPYNQPPQLTSAHLAPEVLAEAQSLAARQGIKLDIPLEDTSLDVRAYNDALVDPATVGSGAIAQAKALSARKRFNGSVDGLGGVADGMGTSASPAPGAGGAPGPSGTQTPMTASPAISTRGPAGNKGKNKGNGRWGHLYAKRAQQAAAVKAEKERSALLAAGGSEEAKAETPGPAAAADAPPVIELSVEEVAEQKEKEERERAEQAEAARLAAEEKKRETMAKALGSASYWNHLLIEARRQRGPQWDVNTQMYQVDRGSALYYSDVRGPPPTPPPAEPDLPDVTETALPPVAAATPLPAINGIDISVQAVQQPSMPPPTPGMPPAQPTPNMIMMQQQQEVLRRQQQMQFEQQQRQQNATPSAPRPLQPQHSGSYQQAATPGPQQQLTPRQQMQRLGSVPSEQQPGRAMSGTPGSEHGSQARPQSAGRQSSVPQGVPPAFAQPQPPQQQQPPATPAQIMQMMQGMQQNNAGTPTPMRPPSAMAGSPALNAGQYSQAQLAQMHRQLQQMQNPMQQKQPQQQQPMNAQGIQPQAMMQGMQGQNLQQMQAQQLQAQMAQRQREMLQARMNGLPTSQFAGQMQPQQQKQGGGMSVGLNGSASFPAMPQGMSPQQMAAFQAQAQGNRQAQYLMQQAGQGMYNGMPNAMQQQPGNMMAGGKMQQGGTNSNGAQAMTPLQMQQMYAQYQAANQGR